MANKEFKNIEEFIEGFTRNGPTPENYNYDGVIWGMEFQYKNRIFRVTRDTEILSDTKKKSVLNSINQKKHIFNYSKYLLTNIQMPREKIWTCI